MFFCPLLNSCDFTLVKNYDYTTQNKLIGNYLPVFTVHVHKEEVTLDSDIQVQFHERAQVKINGFIAITYPPHLVLLYAQLI